jgi:hypothetical protein
MILLSYLESADGCSEMFVNVYQKSRCHIPEDSFGETVEFYQATGRHILGDYILFKYLVCMLHFQHSEKYMYYTNMSSVGSEVFTAVVLKSIFFWDMTPCSALSGTRRFGGAYHLHLQGRKISRARDQRESSWQAELCMWQGCHMLSRWSLSRLVFRP